MLAALAVLAGPVDAGVNVKPKFTAEELAIIERNALLKRTVESDPDAVRSFLDAMEETDDASHSDTQEAPSDNPDIDRLQRSSPQAAHDLIQIMKQVGAGDGTLRSLDR